MRHRLESLAGTARLLIACDFDGTLAPIVDRPEQARAAPEVLDDLRRAAGLPDTAVAIVSGRALDVLKDLVGGVGGIWLVGGHGSEISGPGMTRRPADASLALEAVAQPLRDAAPESMGFLHERKPSSIAVHYRGVPDVEAGKVVSGLVDSIARPAGLHVKHGKKVIEFLASDADKGQALAVVRKAVGATGILYVGDDITDEDAFRVLGDDDVAVKVGTPPTSADYTIDSVEQTHQMLSELIRLRAQIVGGRGL